MKTHKTTKTRLKDWKAIINKMNTLLRIPLIEHAFIFKCMQKYASESDIVDVLNQFINCAYDESEYLNIGLWAKSILKVVQKKPELDAKLVLDAIRLEMGKSSTKEANLSVFTKAEQLLKSYVKEQQAGIQ